MTDETSKPAAAPDEPRDPDGGPAGYTEQEIADWARDNIGRPRTPWLPPSLAERLAEAEAAPAGSDRIAAMAAADRAGLERVALDALAAAPAEIARAKRDNAGDPLASWADWRRRLDPLQRDALQFYHARLVGESPA